jgi:phosphoglycerol transferase MdoB-like AlkP superfamily enzyme
MGAWKRWQDWATVLLGVIFFATPFVFQTTGDTASSWTAYVMGGLMVVVGLYAASMEKPLAEVEGVPLILGIALFVAPWVLSFTNVPEIAWMAWIVAVLLAVNAAAELLVLPQQSTTA